jgi:D-alanyl-D-alanine carboxypeptidase (penicillin-binding protein 5/6)
MYVRGALVACLVLLATAGLPAAAAAPPSPVGARAAILIDAEDGDVMFQRNAGERRSIASATKLMTALLALERSRPNDVFAAPPYDALPAESKIGLRAGERILVEDLLEALLLESANDAAEALAEGIAGSRGAFVREMNERAAALGLTGTRYANPIGLDDPGNYSTASDLAKLTRRVMRNRRFARIVDMSYAVLESGARRRVVRNRNDLIRRFPFVNGVKTGYTIDAGNVLVGAARGPGGGKVISVVLGEPSEAARDEDTLALLRFGLSQFRRVRVLSPRRVVARPSVKYRDERAELVPRRALAMTARRGERIARRVSAPDEIEGPLPAGRRVGYVTVLRDGEPVGRVALVTARHVPGAGTFRVITSALGVPLTLLVLVGILGVALALIGVRVRLVRAP